MTRSCEKREAKNDSEISGLNRAVGGVQFMVAGNTAGGVHWWEGVGSGVFSSVLSLGFPLESPESSRLDISAY